MPIRPMQRPTLTAQSGVDDAPAVAPTRVIDMQQLNARPRRRPVVPGNGPAPLSSATTDYDVGYRKPPRHRRFKPGQSGNPKGRPKGAKSLNTMARAVFGETVVVRNPAGERRMNAIELGFNKLRELAAKGDIRAIQTMLDHWGRSVPEPAETPVSTPASKLAPEDAHIIDQLFEPYRADQAQPFGGRDDL